jgi:hypothetical protein
MPSLRGATHNLPRRSLLPNAMRLRNALSCAVAWCVVVIPYRRFGTTSRSHFEGSSVRMVLRYTSKYACNLIHLCKKNTAHASPVFKKLNQQFPAALQACLLYTDTIHTCRTKVWMYCTTGMFMYISKQRVAFTASIFVIQSRTFFGAFVHWFFFPLIVPKNDENKRKVSRTPANKICLTPIRRNVTAVIEWYEDCARLPNLV